MSNLVETELIRHGFCYKCKRKVPIAERRVDYINSYGLNDRTHIIESCHDCFVKQFQGYNLTPYRVVVRRLRKRGHVHPEDEKMVTIVEYPNWPDAEEVKVIRRTPFHWNGIYE